MKRRAGQGRHGGAQCCHRHALAIHFNAPQAAKIAPFQPAEFRQQAKRGCGSRPNSGALGFHDLGDAVGQQDLAVVEQIHAGSGEQGIENLGAGRILQRRQRQKPVIAARPAPARQRSQCRCHAALGPHHALGFAGRPGGEENDREIVGCHLHQRCPRHGAPHDVRQFTAVIHGDDTNTFGQATIGRAQLAGHAAGGYQQAGRKRLEYPPQPVGRPVELERHINRAGRKDAEDKLQGLRRAGQTECHPVASANPLGCLEPAGEAQHAIAHLTIIQAPRRRHDVLARLLAGRESEQALCYVVAMRWAVHGASIVDLALLARHHRTRRCFPRSEQPKLAAD